jgi:hypothetical protein
MKRLLVGHVVHQYAPRIAGITHEIVMPWPVSGKFAPSSCKTNAAAIGLTPLGRRVLYKTLRYP